MTLKQAFEILKKHNEWRTDKNVPTRTEMQNYRDITEAINEVVDFFDIKSYQPLEFVLKEIYGEVPDKDDLQEIILAVDNCRYKSDKL